jgi:hypothetical protein
MARCRPARVSQNQGWDDEGAGDELLFLLLLVTDHADENDNEPVRAVGDELQHNDLIRFQVFHLEFQLGEPNTCADNSLSIRPHRNIDQLGVVIRVKLLEQCVCGPTFGGLLVGSNGNKHHHRRHVAAADALDRDRTLLRIHAFQDAVDAAHLAFGVAGKRAPPVGSGLLEQLGVELVHDAEVGDYRLEVAVVFLLGNRDAVKRLVIAEGDLTKNVAANALE